MAAVDKIRRRRSELMGQSLPPPAANGAFVVHTVKLQEAEFTVSVRRFAFDSSMANSRNFLLGSSGSIDLALRMSSKLSQGFDGSSAGTVWLLPADHDWYLSSVAQGFFIEGSHSLLCIDAEAIRLEIGAGEFVSNACSE
ncbi:MAG: hypothetical protein DVB23_002443 [Verrucomicrobia bacterium]|jgi:hypothetical protein|nr:MAG: hypothetical protein DVB23_002443 [Verrucomicrobiota bacterium]